jgi:uncharacterized protein YecT (DUF1311 family)
LCGAEFRYQDQRLNKAYKSVVNPMTGTEKQDAVDAQRAWLALFAKDCSARASRFGSANGPAMESVCRMQSTALRAQQLEDWQVAVSSASEG